VVVEALTEHEIGAHLAAVPEWQHVGAAIERDFECDDFAGAVAFVNVVADLAEAANHHPDILVYGWKHVRLTLSTHTAGGLTKRDFALAAAIDAVA
jgi:4a-hydroxytetrahydrobiopterin dehydratase